MIAITSFLDKVEEIEHARITAKAYYWEQEVNDYFEEVSPEIFKCFNTVGRIFGQDSYSSCLFVFYLIVQRSKRDEAVQMEFIRAVQCFKRHTWCRTQNKALRVSPDDFLDKADGVAAFVIRKFYVFIHTNPDPCFTDNTRNGMLCALALLLNAK